MIFSTSSQLLQLVIPLSTVTITCDILYIIITQLVIPLLTGAETAFTDWPNALVHLCSSASASVAQRNFMSTY